MTKDEILSELKAEHQRIGLAISALEGGTRKYKKRVIKRGTGKTSATPPDKKLTMSDTIRKLLERVGDNVLNREQLIKKVSRKLDVTPKQAGDILSNMRSTGKIAMSEGGFYSLVRKVA